MKTLNEIDFEAVDGDTLGDAYEYLIGEFASESGKSRWVLYPTSCLSLDDSDCLLGREDQKEWPSMTLLWDLDHSF